MHSLIETPELDKIILPNWFKSIQYNTLQKNEISLLFENEVWITARKEKMYVIKMTTSHINNCIKCFNGIGKTHIPMDYLGGRDKWVSIFKKELLNRQ